MFKKVEDLSKPNLVSKSGIRDLRDQASKLFPQFELVCDDILPKKQNLNSSRLRSEHQQELIASDTEILFFSREELLFPHLRLLHRYPDLLRRVQIDKGGLKYIFDGANVMCPGLTSPGGRLCDFQVGDVIAIYVEEKQHAVAVGVAIMSSDDIKKINKGIAITTLHHLGDALWVMQNLKSK